MTGTVLASLMGVPWKLVGLFALIAAEWGTVAYLAAGRRSDDDPDEDGAL